MDQDKINEEKKQEELKKIQQSLAEGGLSRRRFIDSMKAIGVGFGAAYLLGVNDASAATNPDAAVNVTSTNPALDEILAEAQEERGDGADGEFLSAQYGRRYRRGYRRYGRHYRRGYRRYGRYYRRGYRRYARHYRRRYRRW